MQLAIGSYAYRWAIGIGDAVGPTRLSPAGLVERAARLGVHVVQIADNLPLHRKSEVERKALKRALDEHDVTLELGFGGISPGLMRTYLDLADRFGVRLIRVAPDAEDAGKPVGVIVAILQQIAPDLVRRGITLAVENHFHLPSPKLRELVVGVGSPSVGVCLDVANSIAVGEWPDDTIELLTPHAVNLHLKDYKVTLDPYGVGLSFAGTPLGTGKIDAVAVLRRLVQVRPDMTVVLEQWSPRGRDFAESCATEEEWMAASVEYARRILTQVAGEAR